MNRFPKFVFLDEVPASGAAPAAGGAAPSALSGAPAAGAPAAGAPAAGAPAAGEQKPAAGTPAAGEQKPAAGEQKPAAGEQKPAAGEQKPAAGELTVDGYKAALKLPEGFKLDDKVFGAFADIAAKANVSHADMQKFMDEYVQNTVEAAKAPYRLWSETQTKWRNELAADKDIGGANLDANLAIGKRYIDSLPNAAAVKAALDYTGAGNNPDIVKAFVAAGKLIKEGTPVAGAPAGQSGAKKTAAEVFYPTAQK